MKFIVTLLTLSFLAITVYANNSVDLTEYTQKWEERQEAIDAACKRIGRKSAKAYASGDFSDLEASETWFANEFTNSARYACFTNAQQNLDIVVHHTALLQDEYPEQLRTIEKKHRDRGYEKSCFGFYLGYHFFIGTDGTLKQQRCLDERPLHSKGTIDPEISERSVAIVLAGDFNTDEPTREQVKVLKALILQLQKKYNGEVKGHLHTSATQCPGKNLLSWLELNYRLAPGAHGPTYHEEEEDIEPNLEYGAAPFPTDEEREHIAKSLAKGELLEPEIVKHYRSYHDDITLKPLASFDMHFSRYYTPVKGQDSYYRDSYEADFAVNCHGDCFTTADGTQLEHKMAGTILACPQEFYNSGRSEGVLFYIEDHGFARCADTGGMITKEDSRLDLWSGVGQEGLNNIRGNIMPTGLIRVTVITVPNEKN